MLIRIAFYQELDKSSLFIHILNNTHMRKKKKKRSNGTAGEKAIQNALEKGYITQEQVLEYRKLQGQREAKKQQLKKDLKYKRPARIMYGLNTNSM